MSERKTVFRGEMQLQAWGESNTQGAWVKLWIHHEDLEVFRNIKVRSGKMAGQRLAAMMIEIGDDELPIPEDTPAATPAPAPAPAARYHAPHIGPVGMLAVRWCKDQHFQRWVAMQVDGTSEADESVCKSFILEQCGVYLKYGTAASRKHLDTDPTCTALFHERIRLPYIDYRRDNGLDHP